MFANLAEIDDRQFRALTGLSHAAFDKLLPIFTENFHRAAQERYEQHRAKRQRKPGAGQKGKLETMEKKLFFSLYYFKTYPTFDVLGDRFGLDRSKACTNVHRLTPVVTATLNQLGVLPKRKFDHVEELTAAFANVEKLLIDATERPCCRPQDSAKQQAAYSGKKKHHTVKNTVMASTCRQILFLGYTVFGSQHDYARLKAEFPPEVDWFAQFKIWVDLGYLGFQKDYRTLELHIPHKKPRKSETNPAPTLTDSQKEDNRQMSRIRIAVENAICKMKHFNILVNKFRNRKDRFVDDVAVVAAGLANWMVALTSVATT
jgi:hypothetical protein